MPTFEFTSPEGKTYSVTGPEGATKEQAFGILQSQIGVAPQVDQPKSVMEWKDVPLKAATNLLPSAARFVGGMAQSVFHPIDTVSGLLDATAGAAQNALPKPVVDFVNRFEINPQASQRAVKTADAIGQFYKDRYGSAEGIKNAVATDPVGVAADVSTVLAGGAGLARAAANLTANAPKISNALASIASKTSALADATNPVNALTYAAKKGAEATGFAGRTALGLTTGQGPENIRTAFESGLKNKTSFIDNLSGKADMVDALDAAKQNLANMGAQKAAEYRSGMVNIKGDKTVLNFNGIDDAIKNASSMVTFKGQIKNEKGAQAAQKAAEIVDEWKSLNPAEYHTPEGLDALKQKVGGVLESIPFEEKTARKVVGSIYDSIKQEINTQAPVYASVMKDYSEATELIGEIERALSLGKKASADTALRKLQSLSRNNANTNFGHRLDLAKTLESQGGNEILPAIAGQAMNTWTPRGLVSQGAGLYTMGNALTNPALMALLPLQSPKAVGLAAYGAGKVAAPIQRGMNALNARDSITALLAAQAGNMTNQ